MVYLFLIDVYKSGFAIYLKVYSAYQYKIFKSVIILKWTLTYNLVIYQSKIKYRSRKILAFNSNMHQ